MKVWIGALLVLIAGCAWMSGAPNIVVFFSDDHTQQAVSAYQDLPGASVQNQVFKGWPVLQTPNIDRLATNGVIFTRSFVSNSICKPSRANLLTGLHSHSNGQTTNGGAFDGSQQTLPKLLQSAGYDTSLFGKWHLSSEPTGFHHYERLIGQGNYYSPVLRTTQSGGGTSDVTYSGDYVAEVVTDRAIGWLQGRIDTSASGPFFLMVNHKGTHRAWQPGPVERVMETFRHVEWDYGASLNPDTDPAHPENWTPSVPPQPANYGDYANNYPTRADGARLQEMEVATHARLNNDLKLPNSSFGGQEYDEIRTWWNANQAGLTQEQRDDYFYQRYIKDYAMTGQSVDRSVGEILDFLETNQLDRNTIIVYASDQGFYLGEHGWFDKRWMYEESLTTPLLMQWKDANGVPLIAPGSEVSEMVQVIDYAPSLLAAAGVTGFQPMHGESFLGYVTTAGGDEPATWRDSLYYHYYEGGNAAHKVKRHYGVRDGRHKLIYHYEVDQWELFDLQNDPTEMNNLLFDSGSGTIDDPTDGIEGPESFQQLVLDLMIELADLRTLYNDTTGSLFNIPGVTPPYAKAIVDLGPGFATFDGQATLPASPTVSQPVLSDGMTFNIVFAPAAGDLTGTVLLMEIGGNSNGSGLYLVDGVPTFVQKQNSSDSVFPDSLNDTALNEVAVQSSFGALVAGIEYSLAVVYDPPESGSAGDLALALRPAGGSIWVDRFGLTGASSGGDWSGNETLSVAVRHSNANSTGGLTTTAGIFNSSTVKNFDGTVDRALYWNAVGSILNQLAITGSSFDGTTFSVDVDGMVTGGIYRLFRSTDLESDAFKLEADSTTATGPTGSLTDDGDPVPLPARAFYRVEGKR